ncbi:MAG TPA: hypothetical protein VMU83_22550 [Hanamia sp.]|nr:hypothetical protein [Hanamia sp.]
MKKVYYFLPILFCYLMSCGQKSIDTKRENTMMKVVNAIIKNDTSEVFRVVDTSFCFQINSKEGFMGYLQTLREALLREGIHTCPRKFISIDPSGNHANGKYKITFLLKKSNYDKIDVEFQFNYGVSNFVNYFNVNYINSRPGLIDAAPNGN